MESEVSRSIEEQLSAFLDGELPNEELQLLVRRLERDGEYRATLARYSLIGNVLRNDPIQSSEGFRGRIMAAIDNEDSATNSSNAVAAAATGKSWFKPFAAAAVLVLVFSGVVVDTPESVMR